MNYTPSSLLALAAVSALASPGLAQVTHAPRPTVPAITAEDLRTRLFIFADDSMMGRNTGTPGHERAVAYLERELRRIGLAPGGENGTYFQTVPFVSRGIDPASSLAADGRALTLWTDYVARDQGPVSLTYDGLPVVFGGFWGDSASLLPAAQVTGKVVLLGVASDPSGPLFNRFNRFEVTQHYPGAAAIAVALLDSAPAGAIAFWKDPGIQLPQDGAATTPGLLYVTDAVATSLLGAPLRQARAGAAGKALTGQVRIREVPRPSRNVIGIIPGSDPSLKGTYIAVGAHSDHVGTSAFAQDHDSVRAYNTVIRPLGADNAPREPTAYEARRIAAELARLRKVNPVRQDTIYNGADDDGSGSVTLLEMAEQMQHEKTRPRRSTLFIWHTGEEEGLFGSQWFTDHPTVPLDSIVAQVDVDMVGRGETMAQKNGANLLVVFGSRRVSSEMGDIVDRVNAASAQPFILDYHMDVDGHPEQGYCRSDNWNYNRYAIPTVSPMTGYHIDYHQVSDEPQYINYDQMARIGRLLTDLTVTLGNLDHRLVADHGTKDPTQQCRQ
ncbi:MAG TPA: M28 family peptidase [Gemmatimonadales bacterium]|nr:M28 family peptidase [Gemmatimonadales bacterium]